MTRNYAEQGDPIFQEVEHQHRYTVVVEQEVYPGESYSTVYTESGRELRRERIVATKVMCEGCGEIKVL